MNECWMITDLFSLSLQSIPWWKWMLNAFSVSDLFVPKDQEHRVEISNEQQTLKLK